MRIYLLILIILGVVLITGCITTDEQGARTPGLNHSRTIDQIPGDSPVNDTDKAIEIVEQNVNNASVSNLTHPNQP